MNWKQFVLGMGLMLGSIAFVTLVTAATVVVYYAGGNVIGDLDTPTSGTDGATKAYADSAGPKPCVPRIDSVQTQTTTSGNFCTNCAGWFTTMTVTDSTSDGCYADVNIDGIDGEDIDYTLGGGFWTAHFSSNLSYDVTDLNWGWCTLSVVYCEEI